MWCVSLLFRRQQNILKLNFCGKFADEPNIAPELVANENITILPHLGTSTRETLLKVSFPPCLLTKNASDPVDTDGREGREQLCAFFGARYSDESCCRAKRTRF